MYTNSERKKQLTQHKLLLAYIYHTETLSFIMTTIVIKYYVQFNKDTIDVCIIFLTGKPSKLTVNIYTKIAYIYVAIRTYILFYIYVYLFYYLWIMQILVLYVIHI